MYKVDGESVPKESREKEEKLQNDYQISSQPGQRKSHPKHIAVAMDLYTTELG